MVWKANHKVNQAKYLLSHRIRVLVRKTRTRTKWDNNLDETYVQTILDKQNNRCALSGITFNNDCSIDRIDSTKGYLKGNIQLVLTVINRMKRDLDQDTFINYCKEIARNN